MNPDQYIETFLSDMVDLEALSQSTETSSLIKCSGILRRLFLDGNRLVDLVNKHFDVDIIFDVVDLSPVHKLNEMFPDIVLNSAVDSIDPEIWVGIKHKTLHLKLKDFLLVKVSYHAGDYITVKDIISFSANVMGGVHVDPNPKEKYQKQHELASQWEIAGNPSGIRELLSITRVSLKALLPLTAAINDLRNHG